MCLFGTAVLLRAGALAQAAKRLGMAQLPPVRPIGGHRVVRVADEDDARLERDVGCGELVGIPGAVPALVAVADDALHFLQPVDRRDDPLTEHRMHLHDRALRGAQPPRLQEDSARHADLADVVKQCPELEPLEDLVAQAELSADAE